MTKYKLIKDYKNEIVCVVKDDALSIPFDPNNTDYQAYLKWLSEGNEPIPADGEQA